MIDVKEITVSKGKKDIVKDASFQISPGKITVVIGKNGAGKSTLLEALAKTNALKKGMISWDDVNLSQMSNRILAQRRAVLSQKIEMSFSLSVEELVEMGTYVSEDPLSKVKIKSLIQNALREVEMTDFIARDFQTLSGGEQKRVLLAKCITQLNCCHWADVNKYLFLDEPTASLDIEQQFNFIDLVKRLVKRRNIGVFSVLHDLNLAAQFADEILILRDGKIIEKGTPKEVFTPQKLKQAFDIQAVISKHPVFDCPHITTLPQQLFNTHNPQFTNV
ncbi:MAG: heme ABC transporter ATP-binding protein [Bacteroidota bacterium]